MKIQRMIYVLVIITLLFSVIIWKWKLYNPIILGGYEVYLLITSISMMVYIVLGKEIYDLGIVIIALIICIFCLFYNTFMLLFTISLCTENFHPV